MLWSKALVILVSLIEAISVNFFFINSGAWFSIAITLYLASGSNIALLLLWAFFNIKKSSSSILFLSDEGKEIQTLLSSDL